MWKLLLVSPALLALHGAISAPATAKDAPSLSAKDAPATSKQLQPSAAPEVDDFFTEARQDTLGRNEVSQIPGTRRVNSVDDFSDVPPGHWAREALDDLIQDYGCIAGYPDGTYRGNRTLTRYEFAAALDACVDAILGGRDIPDLPIGRIEAIERLQEEFAAELATLRGRVDSLEERVQFLEDHQFSTTTQLQGEVVFAVSDVFGSDDALNLDDNQTVFHDRIRLGFATSFTGEDLLYTRLDAGNADYFDTVLGDLDQGVFTHSFDNGNDVELGWLAYYFPIGDSIQVYLPAAFPLWQDFVPTISPYLEGYTGANNAISSFAESSPIYKIGLASGGGLGINFELADAITLSAGYFGGDSFSPLEGEGLFNGEYSALGQITFDAGALQLGLTYNHAYFNNSPNSDSSVFDIGPGTYRATNPFGDATTTNSYGVQAAFELSDSLAINAFGMYMDAQQESSDNDAEIWSYGLGIAFPDFGGEGNLLGLFGGAEPYVGGFNGSDSDIVADDVPLHFEAFYRYQLTDGITLTPGVIWLTAPAGEKDADDAIIGILRTTFLF